MLDLLVSLSGVSLALAGSFFPGIKVTSFFLLRAAALANCPRLMIRFLFVKAGSSSDSESVTDKSPRDSSSRSSHSPVQFGSSAWDLPRPPVSRAHSLTASNPHYLPMHPRNPSKINIFQDTGRQTDRQTDRQQHRSYNTHSLETIFLRVFLLHIKDR